MAVRVELTSISDSEASVSGAKRQRMMASWARGRAAHDGHDLSGRDLAVRRMVTRGRSCRLTCMRREFGVSGGDAGDDSSMVRWAEVIVVQRTRPPATRSARWKSAELAKENLHRTGGSIARASEALAGGQDRRGDFREGKVLGRLPVRCFQSRELAVAVGQAGGGVDVEEGESGGRFKSWLGLSSSAKLPMGVSSRTRRGVASVAGRGR